MRGIHKRFPGVQALDDVDFDVRPGEVHALMGQNGAGKSTLINVLTGVHRRDAGSIRFDGRRIELGAPADAQRCGIHTVYQEINLVPTQSVAENLFLGRFPRRRFGIDWRTVRRRASDLLNRFDLSVDVSEPLGRYPIAIQQMVAIVRAVVARARLLILDEPTSSLDRRETDILFGTVDRLKQRGIGIIFVTHFLDQVYRVSDRITVLRNGRRVGTFDTAALPRIELVAHMLGKDPAEAASLETRRVPGEPVLEWEEESVLAAQRLGRRGAIAPFDLHIRRGEVLGLAGLLGSGRTEAARLLFGADRADTGLVRIKGRRMTRHNPRNAVAVGLAFCPEDRKESGVIPDMSVRANIALAVQRTLSRFGIVSRRVQDRIARDFVEKLGIDTPDVERPVRNLSGGNQQKIVLARWLACRPSILILDEPTRGIDVGAKAEVESLVEQLARRGVAVVFISSELGEVLRRSHRIIVFRDRKVIGELTGAQVTMQRVMSAIAARESDEA